MTKLEELFLQIFERKKRIIDQVKHQTQLFDQHLASKCLLEGVPPPPWLFSPSISSLPIEFNKEELISGLLHPPTAHYSLRQTHILPSDPNPNSNVNRIDLPSASCTEVAASNNAAHRFPVLPPFQNDDDALRPSIGVPELDPSVLSPVDCVDARVLDDCAEHSRSLVKIQRSKSRQRALKLRKSAEASKSRFCSEKKGCGGYDGQGIGCGINLVQYDHADELELSKPDERNNRGCDEEEKGKEVLRESEEKNSDIYNGRTSVSGNDGNSSYTAKEDGIHCMEHLIQQPNHFNKVADLVDRIFLATEYSMAEEPHVLDSGANEMNGIVCFDKITRSRSYISQTSTSKEVLDAGNSSHIAEEQKALNKLSAKKLNSTGKLVKSSSTVSKESYGSRKANMRDKQIKDSGSNTYVGRITRSRSSIQQPNHMNDCLDRDNSCGNDEEPRQSSNHVHKVTELVRPLASTESSWLKGKVRECQNIDVGCDSNCQRITSSSIEKVNNVNKSSKACNSSDSVKDGDDILACSFGKFSQPPLLPNLIQGAGINIQVQSNAQPNVLPCSESLIPETDIDGNDLAEARSGTSESISDVAMLVNPKQLDFDDVDNSLHEACDPALEDKRADIEKRLSPLLHSADVLAKATSVGYHEKPNLSIEMPHLEEQEFSIKSYKSASEGHTEDDVLLADESTINNVQQKMDLLISQNEKSDSYFMGSWPQLKRIKIGGQAINVHSASPSSRIQPYQPMHTYQKGDSVQSDVIKCPVEDMQSDAIKSPVEYMHWGVEHQRTAKSEVSSSKLQVDEVKISLEGMGRNVSPAFSLMLQQQGAPFISVSKRLSGGVQGSLLEKAGVADPASTVFDVIGQGNEKESQGTGEHTAEENCASFQLEDELELEDARVLNYTEEALQENQYRLEGEGNLSYCSSGSPLSQSVIGSAQNMPEFEGFVMETDYEQPYTANEGINLDNLNLPPTELGHASVLERLCKSNCLQTPLSNFSSTYNFNEALHLYQSIPNGLLESIELRSTLNMNGDESNQLGANYSFLDKGIDHTLHVRCHSVSLPLSNAQSAWDIRKPCLSPVGKFWDGIPLKSGSSGKRVSSIPELPCINEENEATDGVPEKLFEGMGPSSVKREPLSDITKNSNPPTSVFEAEVHDRGSPASMNTEVSFSGACDGAKMKLQNKNSNKKRFTRKGKESHIITLEGEGTKRGNGSLKNRFSRPKLSGKASLKNGPSLSEKESKRNNIVSNITSFIPLVQQKQAAAVITGKRDVKVKALEAAEAAKRNAEKKENERKMRKEAMKRERAKMEEKKEEEKKKKEADMAAKKRQREEEERKEKERKRMRVEDAKKHQAHDKKLHAEKEDEKAHERKESKARIGNQEKKEKAKGDSNLSTLPQIALMTAKVPTDKTNESVISEDQKALRECGDNLKVRGFMCNTSETESLVSNITQEQSYEISPYKGSDDEDEDEEEEEDDTRNSKFMPSWASKSNLRLMVSSQQGIDPESIFPPESFCSIGEVLLPRRLQQK